MNKKFLLAAMALPMLFTACSQDEYLGELNNQNGIQAPNAKGFALDLIAPLDVESRALWNEEKGKLTWEANKDLISVYWLGSSQTGTTDALQGNFNSIFKTTDGEAFTSESLVFEGGNIAVYPGNVKYTSIGDIKVTVPYSQDENVITKTPYISNYINVEAAENGQTAQLPGYNNGLYAPMKMAANVLYLDINLAGTANLVKDYNFKVDSVSIVSTGNVFANEATVMNTATAVNDGGKVSYTGADGKAKEKATITKSTKLSATAAETTLTATSVEKVAEGKYHAKFVVLPTAKNTVDADAKIVIYTNCGRIDLYSTEKAEGANAQPVRKDTWTVLGKDDKAPAYAGVVSGKTTVNENKETVAVSQTIADLIEEISAPQVASETSNFKGEFIGKPMKREISADMANATLNNSVVYSSDEIKTYVAIHTAMKSTEKMNLILASRSDKKFDLTSEALALVEGKNTYSTKPAEEKILVTLSNYDEENSKLMVDSVIVSTVGAVYAPSAKAWTGKAANLVLAAGNWTMNDTYAPSTKVVKKVINCGTLTIAGTQNKDGEQNVLAATLKNEGAIKIGGNNKLFLDGDFELGGRSTIEVAASQDLRFAENMASGHDFQGTIKVAADGFLTVADGISVYSAANVENAGTLGSVGTSGGYYNEGTITVKDALATTLVQDNSKGTIKMFSRTDAIKVESENKGEIIYTYTTDDSANFTKTATDKFTTVEFGSDIKTINLTYDKYNKAAIKDVNLTFNGTGAVVLNATDSEKVNIGNLKVGKNAHLKINPDNAIYVQNVKNEGKVTAAGNIYYYESYIAEGEVISTGGSITPVDSKAVQNNITAQLKAAMAADATAGTAKNPVKITLTEDYSTLAHGIVFDGATVQSRAAAEPIHVVLDLQGKTLQNTSDIWAPGVATALISVKGNYEVTIKGNGKVIAKENDCYAVEVRDGGKLIIEDGEFVGNITAAYALQGSVEIKGGSYKIQQLAGKEYEPYSQTLNCFDANYKNKTASIKVIGGKFFKFNPIVENSDVDNKQSYVAEGYETKQNGDWFEVVKAAK